MNWIVVVTRNNLALTREAIRTALAQDIGDVQILVVENASLDGTKEWLRTQRECAAIHLDGSVAECWNTALSFLFDRWVVPYALVLNNDLELPANYYRCLVRDGGLFVTGVGVRNREQMRAEDPLPAEEKRYHPDFSAYLIRRECWQRVGPFDDNFAGAFAEDSDYDCRMYRAGIRAYCLDLPYLHHGSATIKDADKQEARRIAEQADRNRAYFREKWGFEVGSPQYYAFMGKGDPISAAAVSQGHS